MTFTKLELFLCDVFERVVINTETYDPDQEIHNFLVTVDQTPESQINQRYLQLLRTLRHDNYSTVFHQFHLLIIISKDIRSGAAKFLCVLSYKNLPLQNRLRSLLPITILTTNLLVFNLPIYYSKSTLAELQKDVTKSDGSSKETIFWHFPSHYLETAEPPPIIDATLHPAIQAMLELKLDPLYQFIGSFTTAKRLRQYRNKPGLLEETLASRFSAPSTGPSESLLQGLRHVKPRHSKPSESDLSAYNISLDRKISQGSVSHRPRSTSRSYISSPMHTDPYDQSPLSARSPIYFENEEDTLSKKEKKNVRQRIEEDDDEDDDRISFGGISKKTPKFSEGDERGFWMPKLSIDPQNTSSRPNAKNRNFKRLSQNINNRSVSPSLQENGQSSTTAHSFMGEGSTRNVEKQTMTVLDILHKTPDEKKDIRFKRSRSNSPYSPKSASFRELPEFSRENSKTSVSQRNRSKTVLDKSPDNKTQQITPIKEKTEALSEMTRETRRLLMFDRTDIYKDYDKQVEMLGLRPFNKGKFENKSFNPSNVLRKVPLPKNDRKKAFIDFLNKRGNETETEKPEPKTKIQGNTFHGRKWKSHMTKARISNFGPKENYQVLISATHAGLKKLSRKRSVGEINRELDAVGENLKMDVASSQEGYLKNIMDFAELGKKAYGDKLTKYLDVLNFEKANYNALNGEKIDEALEIVDVIYDAREKSAAKKNKTVAKSKEPISEELEDSYEERLRRQELDLVYDHPVKMVPPSRLYLKRNALTGIDFHPEERIASQESSLKRFKRSVTKTKVLGAFGNLRTERTMSSESMVSGFFPGDMRHTNISWTSTSIKN